MNKYYVIKIRNAENAELLKWYRTKGGQMFICTLSKEENMYVTEDFIDEHCSLGMIEPSFAELLTTFECEDNY